MKQQSAIFDPQAVFGHEVNTSQRQMDVMAMDTVSRAGDRGRTPISDDARNEFCRDVFGSLPRSDQRRSAELYMRGLVGGKGRRSIRRIATEVAGERSDQALQQFVNQSPWNPQPVRQRLAELLATAVEPVAWVVDEVAFAKHGRYSAGVERQYVSSLGKVSNCQLGVAVSLATAQSSAPVNWRLTLPPSWDGDETKRTRAHVPTHEFHRPQWQYLVDALDDMTVDWGVPVAPVVADAQHSNSVDALLSELDSRGLEYLLQVSRNLRVRCGTNPVRDRATSMLTGRVGVLREIVQIAAGAERQTVIWRDAPEARSRRSQFVIVPVVTTPGDDQQRGRGLARSTPRSLLAEWPLGRPEPKMYWITNIPHARIPDLVALAKLRARVRHDLEELRRSFGLCDYEGRSFAGWHHHVTLASAAYILHLLEQMRDGVESTISDERSAS